MESRDPKTNRIVYEPGLEDGITNDYLAEMEKLGYRTDSVKIPEPAKQYDTITEFEPEEEEELDLPGGWVLVHADTGTDGSDGGRCLFRECNILEVSSSTHDPNKAFILVKHDENEGPAWISVKESFEEVVKKIKDAWGGYSDFARSIGFNNEDDGK